MAAAPAATPPSLAWPSGKLSTHTCLPSNLAPPSQRLIHATPPLPAWPSGKLGSQAFSLAPMPPPPPHPPSLTKKLCVLHHPCLLGLQRSLLLTPFSRHHPRPLSPKTHTCYTTLAPAWPLVMFWFISLSPGPVPLPPPWPSFPNTAICMFPLSCCSSWTQQASASMALLLEAVLPATPSSLIGLQVYLQ